MRSGSTIRLISFLCALLLLASTGGAYATWLYANGDAEERSENMGLTLFEFVWKPEEILPTETPGENYLSLLNSILNNSKVGLNSKKDTLADAVIQYKVVHCSQNVTGGNLKHLLDVFSSSNDKLDFIVQHITDEEFHVYMFESDDIDNGIVGTTRIKVYKTILVDEGNKWVARESQFGHAVMRYLSNSTYIGIDPGEWQQGPLPT